MNETRASHSTREGAAVSALFQETPWRGSPPKLQVIDEATWNAIQHLATTGLLTLNTRATRHLTGDAPPPQKPALTPEQFQRITSKPSPPKNKKSPNSSSNPTSPKKPNPTNKPLKEAEGIESDSL